MGAWGMRGLSVLLAAVVMGVGAVAVGAATRRNRAVAVVASRVDAFKGYRIGAAGYAVHPARVYALIDDQRCAANPSVAFYTQHASGNQWTVHGPFDRLSGKWFSSGRGIQYLCVYLQDASQPDYSATGVLARASKRYREVCPAHSHPIKSLQGVPICSVPRS